MADLGDLAFHVQYHLREVPCAEAGCEEKHGQHIAHRVHNGQATLTLAGSAQLIREAATLVFPHLATVFNPPPPAEQPLIDTQARVHKSHDWGWLSGNVAWCRKCDQVVRSLERTTEAGLNRCRPLDKPSGDT